MLLTWQSACPVAALVTIPLWANDVGRRPGRWLLLLRTAGAEPVSRRALADGARVRSVQAPSRLAQPWPLYLGERHGRVAQTCGLPLRRAEAAVSARAATALLLAARDHADTDELRARNAFQAAAPARGGGIGRKLMELALAECRAENRSTVLVATAAAATCVLLFNVSDSGARASVAMSSRPTLGIHPGGRPQSQRLRRSVPRGAR